MHKNVYKPVSLLIRFPKTTKHIKTITSSKKLNPRMMPKNTDMPLPPLKLIQGDQLCAIKANNDTNPCRRRSPSSSCLTKNTTNHPLIKTSNTEIKIPEIAPICTIALDPPTFPDPN